MATIGFGAERDTGRPRRSALGVRRRPAPGQPS
ncbi:hypothetical protein J2Z30_001018 [Streptomyces iranensis]|uniref:Uncharacterized protein n=1 Tax=Streptomyces iranensis TaxID=576784 RepID=A0ABS4MK22_9ACTN|nr:hypothetical protein [Streptomyces iranensis]